jgi:non-ribosomal peptide synthetase component F
MAEETTTQQTAFGTYEAIEMISLGAKLKQHASFQPNAPAVSCGATTLTYAELHRRTNRLARGLTALGVKHGDMVTIGLPNSVGFVEACYAIWKLGATPQPVSFRLRRSSSPSSSTTSTGRWSPWRTSRGKPRTTATCPTLSRRSPRRPPAAARPGGRS